MDRGEHAARLLQWYDDHARVLPWRCRPDKTGRAHPLPYHVWLSEIMLQQTVVKTVIPYFETFTTRWPSMESLAADELDEVLKRWAGLGYYARARNLHACAKQVVAEHEGCFPQQEKALLGLPGIGPYTAAAIRAIGFNQPATVVDGNVERVIVRLYALKQPLSEIKPLIRQKAETLTPSHRPGDYAQAMMDLGATVCTPKRPACDNCPLTKMCLARQQDCAQGLPARAPKKEKPIRTGTAFVIVREDGAILLRRRPDKGLLAKMQEVPSIGWFGKVDKEERLLFPNISLKDTDWRTAPGMVRHTFTHFHLQLDVQLTYVDAQQGSAMEAARVDHRFVPRQDLAREALPGVMRKILSHAFDFEESCRR